MSSDEIPEAGRVDFSLPDDLTEQGKIECLREIVRELRDVTGRESGVTPHQDVGTGQPVWVMWSPDDDEDTSR